MTPTYFAAILYWTSPSVTKHFRRDTLRLTKIKYDKREKIWKYTVTELCIHEIFGLFCVAD